LKNDNKTLSIVAALGGQLKAKSRHRREALVRMAQSSVDPDTRRNDLLPTLSIDYMPINQLRPLKRKLRKLDPAHVREVAASISALGFCDPLLIGQGNDVIDGEIRLDAAKLLGLDSVPCIRVGHLSTQEQRLLRLALNRLGEKGRWDLDELKIEFEELILEDASIEITGFSVSEIDQIVIGDELDAVEVGPLEPDPNAIPIAKCGDMFKLGPHRVICGDATDPEILARLMEGDAPARFILTDQPYNVKIAGNVTGGPHREFAMASGEMNDAEYLKFNERWLRAALPHLIDGAIIGTFIDWRGLHTVHTAAAALGLTPINLVVWAKTNAGMGSLYRSQHELLALFKKGNAAHVNNVELGKTGRWRSNVWTYPGASSLGSEARRGIKDHPTVKPTAMLQDALLDLTHRGDIVLDPFLGSGSMIVAAERTGRVCRGLELDPLYVDVIVRRYEAASGNAAMLVETSEASNEVGMRRRSENGSS
jgi:DNA modification methylase